MPTYTDMKAQAEACRQDNRHAEALLAMSVGLSKHAVNWFINDTSNFIALLSQYNTDALAYYRKEAAQQNNLKTIELWVRQVCQAKIELENVPLQRRAGRFRPDMLDELEGDEQAEDNGADHTGDTDDRAGAVWRDVGAQGFVLVGHKGGYFAPSRGNSQPGGWIQSEKALLWRRLRARSAVPKRQSLRQSSGQSLL